jgi:hypothetical protein
LICVFCCSGSLRALTGVINAAGLFAAMVKLPGCAGPVAL